MKEIIALHERILAEVIGELPEEGIALSSDEDIEGLDALPPDLQTEVLSLQETLDNLVIEEFEYYVIIGSATIPPKFGLSLDESPAGSAEDGTFDLERSLFDQLRLLD